MATGLLMILGVLAIALVSLLLGRRYFLGRGILRTRTGTFTWQKTSFGLPPMQDVGATNYDRTPREDALQPIWFVGIDGSLWMLDGVQATQIPSPGDLTRIAVSPNDRKWCVDQRGTLWAMFEGNWSKIDVPGESVRDVSVSADATVWAVMRNGRYYSITGASKPRYHGVLLSLEAIAGVAKPSDTHPFGVAWGVSRMLGSEALCYCAYDGWVGKNLFNVTDLSVSDDGTVWMVKSDGTIWITTDGELQLRSDNVGGFRRISAGVANTWGVTADGAVWVLAPPPSSSSPTHPSSPKEPSTPASPGSSTPVISISVRGSGEMTVFQVTGSDFTAGAQVTLRGARIADGSVPQAFWLTNSNGSGKISVEIPLPCVPGVVISFSATDGRSNPGDLTGKLWSNTVPATCP